MSLEDLDDADIETLRQLLQNSSRAAPERRRSLCIEIGFDPSHIINISTIPESDFAIELIDQLQQRKLNNSIYKLCQVLKPDFRGGEYAPKLEKILSKLNNNYNTEPSNSTATDPVEIQHLSEAIPQQSENIISHPTSTEVVKEVHPVLPNRSSLRKILMVSLGVTGTLIGLRFFAVFQSIELKFFDNLMQTRPDEGMDKRLLIVKITDKDILDQDKRGERGKGSLRDPSLNSLLATLEEHKPRLIGLDLYRPFSADPNVPDLLKRLQQKNVFAVCKTPAIEEQSNSSPEPPKEVFPENIGFSDFVSDTDGVVRRHLMLQARIAGTTCLTQQSFSLLLARRYLQQELGKRSHYQDPFQSGNDLELDGVVFQPLQPFSGGYQDVDNRGYQILLNYRATSSGKIAQELTVEDILNKRFRDEDVRDKIVLIGSDAQQQGTPDHWTTPYGTVNGVTVHGHMISQIISAVLDRRSLLSVLPQGVEIIWIWGWALAGGFLAYYWRGLKILPIALCFVILVLCICIICFICLWICSLWIPLVPPIIAFIGTSFTAIYITRFYRFPPKNIR
ncbi:CHASE2 domain-containing protein [Aetokthonos hydrillicola Thurmond2011]|jgi:CHASE2 domain-containing sensor protein|uniref:CHASE2 domain-containing protein n=1 Tax=Aetokthonos hydrillicola Thurmond2011 TaxID=2712845 RepID=A0AAP5M6Q8_9CYAN|nr:CHASE2 domain-containing protein [Aetokthonos hydrillicola]MBO3460782.1 CHASE2 domain-containing protein [Aetokthonos hydrillicola CCALA 1050]MBW4585379.1 CHASE2 domain-containing protein [Aetokthonos hydrillicola CCALA 1050]MDR9897276.1 CHASE2 domain-containing protein [Aetokthonos hydrillicola Thurmond2011]